MTHHGESTPWVPEKVQVFLAKMRQEINNPNYHAYYYRKRVWAQKPYDTKPEAESKVEVEKLA